MLVFFTNLSLTEFQVRYMVLFLHFWAIGICRWFWKGILHKNILLIREALKAPLLVLYFSYYTLMAFLMMLSVILLSMLMIQCYAKCEQVSNLWQQLLNLNLIYMIVWIVACWFQCLKKKRFHLTGLITLVLLMWKWIDLEEKEEKLSFKIFGLTFPSKLYWSSYIISIAKSVSKKIGALICAVKFLSPGVVLYL